MTAWRLVFLLLGVALLTAVVMQVDLTAVLGHVRTVGWGMAAVLGVISYLSWRIRLPGSC
jgi:hypothetical protein